MKTILLYLLISHVLGDYYLQTEAIADNKHEDPRVFRQHLLHYAIPFLIAALYLQLDRQFLAAALLAVLLHSLIDLGKRAAGKSPVYFTRDEGKLYGLDQFLHMVSLIALAMAFKSNGVSPLPWIETTWAELGLTSEITAKWGLALLLIYKPSNITFAKLFRGLKPVEASVRQEPGDMKAKPEATDTAPPPDDLDGRANNLKAGGIIGVLEKFLSLILLSLGEFAAVGLVLTAKSIARYDRISKDPAFAEYYLIGTLTSIIMVFVIFILCFQIL